MFTDEFIHRCNRKREPPPGVFAEFAESELPTCGTLSAEPVCNKPAKLTDGFPAVWFVWPQRSVRIESTLLAPVFALLATADAPEIGIPHLGQTRQPSGIGAPQYMQTVVVVFCVPPVPDAFPAEPALPAG